MLKKKKKAQYCREKCLYIVMMIVIVILFVDCDKQKKKHWYESEEKFAVVQDKQESFLTMVRSRGSHSDWKTWKNGKAFSSQGILNRLEKSGKITQNTGKLWGFGDLR